MATFKQRATTTVLTVATFIVAWVVIGSLVFYLFRVTGNFDSAGADFGLYPAALTLVLSVTCVAVVRRRVARRARDR